jgi:hypothetical protein
VSLFLRNAQEILDVARSASGEDCDFTLLVDGAGALRMVSDPGWEFESLRSHYGAAAAYRVRRAGTRVRIEGVCGEDRCLLESQGAAAQAHRILADRPLYFVQSALAAPDPLPAG